MSELNKQKFEGNDLYVGVNFPRQNSRIWKMKTVHKFL